MSVLPPSNIVSKDIRGARNFINLLPLSTVPVPEHDCSFWGMGDEG